MTDDPTPENGIIKAIEGLTKAIESQNIILQEILRSTYQLRFR